VSVSANFVYAQPKATSTAHFHPKSGISALVRNTVQFLVWRSNQAQFSINLTFYCFTILHLTLPFSSSPEQPSAPDTSEPHPNLLSKSRPSFANRTNAITEYLLSSTKGEGELLLGWLRLGTDPSFVMMTEIYHRYICQHSDKMLTTPKTQSGWIDHDTQRVPPTRRQGSLLLCSNAVSKNFLTTMTSSQPSLNILTLAFSFSS
jgi:hypothetical protein